MIFTLLALFGATVASYTDLKRGIIQNKLTFSLFGVGIFGNLILTKGEIMMDLLSGILLMFVIAYSFWRFAGWSAGDGKLFLSLAALLPRYPTDLSSKFNLNPAVANYPFIITIFINTILMMFPILIFLGVFLSLKKGKGKKFLEPLTDIKKVAIIAMQFTALLLLSNMFNVNFVLVFLILFFLRILLSVLLRFNLDPLTPVVNVFTGIIVVFFVYRRGAPLFVIEVFIGILLSIILFRFVWNSINVMIAEGFREEYNINELKEGMILGDDIYIENDKVVSIKKWTKENIMKGKDAEIEAQARGLTLEEIEKLKWLQNDGKLNTVIIKKGTPFGLSVLFGLLLSLIFGDIMMVVRNG
jgi:preflagellin peptidase FlaK